MTGNSEKGTVATIGVFDGVHVGHARILGEVARRAREGSLLAAVVTFDPHPDEVLAGRTEPESMLTSHDEKASLLAESGMDMEVVLRFTREVAGLDAEEFIRRYLLDPLRLKTLVVGHDFRMGKGRQGGREVLGRLGSELGFSVVDVGAVLVDGLPVSSTRAREAVRAADLTLARRLLGRPYAVEGKVTRGDGIGVRLGFPTVNLTWPERKLLPPDGVYAGVAESRGETFKAAINLGRRPSVGGGSRRLEAHLIGFEGDLVGERLKLNFMSRIRPEKAFSTTEDLRNAIRQDVITISQLLDKT
ncbi:MAG: bifunctional riboflavin kinase/FAD synthetase [Candidatus Eisenbacteria bacterium]|nr:bifunctional riboflavin kinase/FAD synthetase [Candidatus Eisenbacteria bacterium]